MPERANDISVQEFAALARDGKLNEATGEPNPMEAGTGTTPISIGAAAGYPLEDIAHFYIARQLPEKFRDRTEASRLVAQVTRSAKDAAESNTILRAFDRFAADAATETQAEAVFAKPRTGLTAPNGQPSNLNAEDHALVRTPEFKDWAGDWEALEYQTRIEQFILDALDGKKDQGEIPLRKVTAQEVNEVMRQGGPNISGMEHVLDAAHIRHAFNSHSSKEEGDKNPGQRQLTKNDLIRIPEIINSYDSLRVKKAGTNRTSIIYGKSYQDGTINYIERVFETSKRNKPRLVTKTVWAVTEAGVKSNSTRVYTPDRDLKLPLANGRVNSESIKIQTDENGEPLASEIARFRQETAAESDQAPLAAKPRRTPPPLPPMEKRIEASLDAIENWNNVLRAAEEKPAGIREVCKEPLTKPSYGSFKTNSVAAI